MDSRTGAAGGPLELFAVTAPGLEGVCAAELRGLGVAGDVEAGGVAWRGDARSLYRANLELRTASRVLVRLASFRARTFHELERHAARVPWRRCVAAGGVAALRVTSRKSKLYHEGAVAERLARGLEAAGVRVEPPADEEGDVASSQLIIVRVLRDVFTISADASGVLLHRRGYRQALAKAPLRETIAAAMLLESGWDGRSPIVDPLCGSGTIAVEAALLARRVPPGLAAADRTARRYAFERWPDFDADVWRDVVMQARAAILPPGAAPIRASDRDAGAVRAAQANAERAGVQADIDVARQPLGKFAVPSRAHATGAVVTNPPYGVRVGERRALAGLYAELGRVLRERAPGWRVALLAADDRLAAAAGLPLEARLHTRNGGIAVTLLAGCVPVTTSHKAEPEV